MGFFDKPIVTCSVCGKEVGPKEKRWTTKDGFLCPVCQKPFGILNGSRAFIDYTTEQIREMQSKRVQLNKLMSENREMYNSFKTTRIIENTLYIDDNSKKWYFNNGKNGLIDINGNIPVPWVFDFSDILEVYVSVGGKTIFSTSSTRKVKGIRKALVGKFLAGNTGAILGGMMAKSKTETRSIVNQDVFVNVIIDGENEPFSMQYINEHSAEKVHHVLSSMIEDPAEEYKESDSVSSVSVPDEIRKFKELLDDGIITQEEFNTKKKQLLGL